MIAGAGSAWTLALPDARATEALGARLAGALRAGDRIYLSGDLGAGKTTLVRGLLRALGEVGPVRSPTYTLLEPYETAGLLLWHLDLYRVADAAELEYLGLRDALDERTVLLLEWPERGAGWLPLPDLSVRLEVSGHARACTIVAESQRGHALMAILRGRE